jgi:phosphonate transport system substrate-binding protein
MVDLIDSSIKHAPASSSRQFGHGSQYYLSWRRKSIAISNGFNSYTGLAVMTYALSNCRIMAGVSALFCILAAAFITGCQSDMDAATVDFSKRVNIERPRIAPPSVDKLRVAVAAIVSPKETLVYYHELLKFIGDRNNLQVDLVQRKTYTEINELLASGDIDLALICSGPYATGKNKFGFFPIAQPVVRNSTTYQSYLIVNADSTVNSIEELRGHKFAYTDPESNTGCLVPKYLLHQKGEIAERYFNKIIYTYSHDNSIMAVARSMVDGAFVHGQIWDYFNLTDPRYTSKTRVIYRSVPFGNPPVVASPHLSEKSRLAIRDLLFSMHLDPRGKQILDHLMIQRFIPVQEDLYDPIRRMHAEFAERRTPDVHDEKSAQ